MSPIPRSSTIIRTKLGFFSTPSPVTSLPAARSRVRRRGASRADLQGIHCCNSGLSLCLQCSLSLTAETKKKSLHHTLWCQLLNCESLHFYNWTSKCWMGEIHHFNLAFAELCYIRVTEHLISKYNS